MADEQTSKASNDGTTPVADEFFDLLITANHILHYHQVVDAYGHISCRNPENPDTFFISKDSPPALVSQRSDIEEYLVSDASPVNKNAPKGYVERYIHSELYKKYSDVHAVIHSHSEAVLPFSISSCPLRPVFHMAGVTGSKVPVFDIELHYKASDSIHSLLINNEHLGAALASGFNPSTLSSKATNMVYNLVTSSKPEISTFPPNPTVLMRGHGFTCVGKSIQEAVFRAVYTCTNARVQTTAMMMQGSYNIGMVGNRFGEKDPGPAKIESIRYLSDRESKDSWTAIEKSMDRPWKLWCAEAASCGLYKNEFSV